MTTTEGTLPVSQVVTSLPFASRDRDKGPGVSGGPEVPGSEQEGVLHVLEREDSGGSSGGCGLPVRQG